MIAERCTGGVCNTFAAVIFTSLCVLSVAPAVSADGVYCGSEDRICPLSSPICCGTRNHFCITAGFKCCGEAGGTAVMCMQSEVCCPGDTSFSKGCCPAGYRCAVNIFGVGSCVADLCAAHSSQDSCLNEANDGKCGWCCAEHRCVPLSAKDLPPGGNSGCSAPPLKTLEETCSSRCYEADTCGSCTSHNDDPQQEPCAWCCATMTCMPTSDLWASCVNEQYTLDNASCHGCYSGGAGVSPYANSTVTIYAMLSSFMLLFAAAAFLIGVRVLTVTCLDMDKPTAQQVQEMVRRYGFTAGDARPSSPVLHHRPPETGGPPALPGEGTASGDAAQAPFPEADRCARPTSNTVPTTEGSSTEVTVHSTVCAACKKPIRLSRLEASLVSAAAGSTRPKPPRTVAAGNADNSGGQSAQAQADDTTAATASPEAAPPASAVADAPLEAKDDPAVVFLPCSHCCCYSCVGIPLDIQEARGEPQTASTAGAPQRPNPPLIEDVVAKKRKGKCPACKSKYKDFLLTERIRSI